MQRAQSRPSSSILRVDALYEQIRRAIDDDRIVFSIHADVQLEMRGMVRWQAVAGFFDGTLLASHPHARPNPKILMRQLLPDGTESVAVWSYVRSIECAKLVTLYFGDKE